MKIIEALKQTKDLQRKVEDLRKKVYANASHLSFETPLYPDTKAQVSTWIQAHSDILKEILSLRVRIQKTNLSTMVTIELDGKQVTKSIAEWIHRRKDLAKLELAMWEQLTDRGLKEVQGKNSLGEPMAFTIVRCYDQKEKDNKMSSLSSEPSIIDGKLEIVNAVTELLE